MSNYNNYQDKETLNGKNKARISGNDQQHHGHISGNYTV